MFMQILQGSLSDPDGARATMDRWRVDLEPGATGYLGGTFGITDDNLLVACVRFDSEASARANSARPEQGRWWSEMERHFAGPVTFHDCSDVTLLLEGGSDDAGFIQVIQGKVKDIARIHGLVEQSGPLLPKYRPDVIGATIAIDGDGYFTETVAFRSEAEARQAEAQEMPAEAKQVLDEEMKLLDDVSFLDLHHPWFSSAKR
ncbi:MAG: hypothetical protein QOE76_2941 [Frankiales bacterium]|jgi:hypothetical protein|nr:hypothetical protein [Frankiales bacterium]MDX6245218.1 hypothetical protein [Frankiales bacterium]